VNKIRKGDQVYVRKGRNRGKHGVVLRVLDDQHLIVEGINMIKRHTKPNPQLGRPGGIIDRESPIPIANVALVNPVSNKPDRIGIRTLQDGRKVRFFKSNGEVVDL
jgi:large subunit ribosomal protein L24